MPTFTNTDVRAAGARIRLISDRDLSAGISAAVAGTNIHALMGIGGAPEGACLPRQQLNV
jgi:fructose-1,6-bisphosphatase/sedoheptulose 1,7-bisphosphatase-like protein